MAIITPITNPFAYGRLDNVLPAQTPNFPDIVANQDTGFPVAQMEDLSNPNSTPVKEEEMNGVLNFYTNLILQQGLGGQYTFDANLSTSQGGYPLGAILYSVSDNTWQRSLTANNTANFVTTPSYLNDGVNWTSAVNCGALLASTVTASGNISSGANISATGNILGANGSGVTSLGNIYSNTNGLQTTLSSTAEQALWAISTTRQLLLNINSLRDSQSTSNGAGISITDGTNTTSLAITPAASPTNARPWYRNSSGVNSGVALLSDFTSGTSGAGRWVQLPNGLIIQWFNQITYGNQTASFPMAFSNFNTVVAVSTNTLLSGIGSAYYGGVSIAALNNSQFTITNASGLNQTWGILFVGY